jgi:hypothetical protein
MDEKSGALAIIGKAGSGKSVLAKTIQRDIVRMASSTDVIVADWFYCRRRGDVFVSYLPLLKSVLYEFLSHNPDGRRLFQYYKAPYRRLVLDPRREWTVDKMEGILISLAGSSSPLVMIFDGIDEAKDDRIADLVQKLVNVPRSSVKAIMLSRPLVTFNRRFWTSRQIILQDWNNEDIQSIIADGLLRLRSTMWAVPIDSFDDSEWPTQEHTVLAGRTHNGPKDLGVFTGNSGESATDMQRLERILNKKANGVILWIMLVFDDFFRFVEAEGIASIPELIERVDLIPTETEDFYQQMVEELSTRLSSGLKKARTALMWISVANEIKQLTFGELWDALAIPDDLGPYLTQLAEGCPIVSRRIEIRSWQDFQSILQRLCGSFIEVLPAPSGQGGKLQRKTKLNSGQEVSEHSTVQLIHQTAKDFLTSSAKAGPLVFTESEAMSMLQSRCVHYLRIVLPEPPLTFPPFDVIHNDPENWRTYLARFAIYLEEYRLLELCSAVVNSHPSSVEFLKYQVDLSVGGFIPLSARQFHQKPGRQATLRHHVYDTTSFWTNAIVSSAFGHLFHFITAHGLLQSAQNITSLLGLRSGDTIMALYQDAIFNGILSTMLDHDALDELTGRILTPGGWDPRGLVREFRLKSSYVRNKCDIDLDPSVPCLSASLNNILHTSQEALRRLPGMQWMNRRMEIDKLLWILGYTAWYRD